MNEQTRRDDIEAVERWFLRRGIPHFIHDYRATEDVFTRAAPLLTLVFLAEVAGALNDEWPAWANVAAGVGGLVVLLGIWALVNRLRGRRPLARPDDVGTVELAVFVLGPALLPLLFGGQVRSALLVAGGNLLGLGAVYLATSYGVVPMTRWALERLGRQVGELWGLVVRALPMLLLFVTFLFINAEVWQVGSDLTAAPFAAAVGLFIFLGVAFVLTRLPQDLEELAHFADGDEMRAIASSTPVARLGGPGAVAAPPPLSRRERVNLSLLLLFAHAVQVLVVVVAIGGFFVLFGFFVISEATLLSWTGAVDAEVLVTATVADRQFVITAELLRVAGFLASFSGLYFAVVAATDETSRREFRQSTEVELRAALAARALYRAAVAAR